MADPTHPPWDRALERIARGGVYAGLLMPVVIIPGLFNQYTFAKMVFLHVVVAASFPAYAALAWRRPELRPRRSLVVVAALVWVGVLGLTTVVAEDPTRAFFGAANRMTGLFSLLHLFAWALMVLGMTTTWSGWLSLLRAHVVLGAFLACVGLVQIASPTFLTFGADCGARVVGLAGNPIFFAEHQLFVFFAAACLWGRPQLTPSSIAAPPGARSGCALAMLLSVTAMVASGSRGPLLGLVAGAFVGAVAFALWKGARKLGAGAVVVVVVGLIAFLVVRDLHLGFFEQRQALQRLFHMGDDGRVGYWTVALAAIPLHPLLGVGLDSFNLAYVLGYTPVNPCTPFHEDRSHNIVLETLTTTGIVGFAAWAFVWIALFAAVVRCKGSVGLKASLLALLTGHLVQSQFAFETPTSWSPFLLVLALLAFVSSSAAEGAGTASSSRPAPASFSVRAQAVLGVAQALAVVVTVLFTLRPAWQSGVGDRATIARAQIDDARAVRMLETAAASSWPYDEEWLLASATEVRFLATEGGFARVPHARALAETTAQRGAEIVKRPAAAARLGPVYGRMLSDVGLALHDDARLAAAETQLRKNVALNPRRGNTVMDLADHLAAVGRSAEAEGPYEALLRDAPDQSEIARRAGIFFWKYRKDRARGAALTIHASQCACRDEPNAQMLAHLSEAHAFLGQMDEVKKLALEAERFNRRGTRWGVAIARHLESHGLVAERNQLLKVMMRKEPALARLQAVVDGTVAHIDDAPATAAAPSVPAP